MIGDGLSHVSFGALAIAVALGFTPLYFSIPVVILAAFFLLRLATNPRWNSDAAIAVMSASALAVGIIVISRTSGMTTDVDNYMFGSVLAMTCTVPCGAGPVRAVLPQALRRDVR
jgi:zinc transport system permease protein